MSDKKNTCSNVLTVKQGAPSNIHTGHNPSSQNFCEKPMVAIKQSQRFQTVSCLIGYLSNNDRKKSGVEIKASLLARG